MRITDIAARLATALLLTGCMIQSETMPGKTKAGAEFLWFEGAYEELELGPYTVSVYEVGDPVGMYEFFPEKDKYLAVAYDRNEVIVARQKFSSKSSWQQSKELAAKAENGDSFALRNVDLLSWVPYPIRGYWLCLGAHERSAEAQWFLGNHYYFTRGTPGRDYSPALKWYLLAVKNGYSATVDRIYRVKADLSVEEIGLAEQWVAEWEPDSVECETLLEAEAGT